METMADFRGDHPRVVEMKPADRDRVVEQHAVIGDIENVGGKLPVFAHGSTRRDVEGRMIWKIGAIVWALIRSREPIGESRSVINIWSGTGCGTANWR